MIYREARAEDIRGMQIVRNAVRENRLSDPALVPDADYLRFIEKDGKGWVCMDGERIAGFAFVDIPNKNIWALFVHPDYEKRGIGKTLHRMMLDWYFSNHGETLWLSTTPDTRAERFYEKQGWTRNGMHGKEIRCEMSVERWKKPLSR